MKTFAKTIAVIGLTFGAISGVAAQPTLVASDNSVTSQLCVTAATGDAMQLHKKMKTLRVSKSYVTEQLTCNGMPVVEFVEQYGKHVADVNDYVTSGEYSDSKLTAKVSF